MKELTAKQQRIWDLKRPLADGGEGKTYEEIAAIIGISRPVVSKTLTVIHKKLGFKPVVGGGNGGATAVELKNPDKAAALIDAMTEPDKYNDLKAALAACGLPGNVSDKMIHRLRVKYTGALTPIRNLKTQEILQMLGEKIHLGLQYLDDKVFAEASARDIMMGLSQLIEKRALLRGEPTQIISNDDRKKLSELLPALVAEGQRRGITMDGTVTARVVGT